MDSIDSLIINFLFIIDHFNLVKIHSLFVLHHQINLKYLDFRLSSYFLTNLIIVSTITMFIVIHHLIFAKGHPHV